MAQNISMNVDDTLELDYLIKQISDDTISIKSQPDSISTSIDYIRKQFGVFDPPDTGTYEIDISGQTIVIEVTNIPDSVVAHYDATQEESTGSISTIIDYIGSFDLSGSCSVLSGGINGIKTYRFDGTESMRVDASIATTEPWALMIVVEFQEGPDSNQTVCDGGSYLSAEVQDDSDRPLDLGRGGTQGSNNFGVRNSGPQIIETRYVNGDSVDLYQNGNFEGNTGSLESSSELDGFTMAARGDNSRNMQVDFGEVVIFDNASGSDLDSERQRLANKWGISV